MIVLGRIVAPYGVKGWVRLHPFGDDPLAWANMKQWWLGSDPQGGDWSPVALEAMRSQGASVVAKLVGVDDRNSAEALDGRYVAAPREELPVPEGNEFYWGDLIGLEVENENGERLGRVANLLETGSHAVLVVQVGDKERLLPFVATVVKQVDLQARCIRVEWQSDW
jgi:16S rRNA processing protein RimM